MLPAFEYRNDKTGGNGIARSRPVDSLDRRSRGASNLLPAVEQARAFGPARHGHILVDDGGENQIVVVAGANALVTPRSVRGAVHCDAGFADSLQIESHAGSDEFRERDAGEPVIADGSDHGYGRSQPCRGERLVGALPAGESLVTETGQRLTWTRQTRDADHKIYVDGADDRELDVPRAICVAAHLANSEAMGPATLLLA